MAVRKNILKLAKKISGSVAMLVKLDENAPEYKVLNCVVTDEMAEVALALELRKPLPLDTIAKRCGKSLEETKKQMDLLTGPSAKNTRKFRRALKSTPGFGADFCPRNCPWAHRPCGSFPFKAPSTGTATVFPMSRWPPF